MTWKSVMYDYVHFRNQLGIQPARANAGCLFADDRLGAGQIDRALRLEQWGRERGIRPQKQETRLKLVRAVETDREVQADIELKRTLEYDLSHALHEERRVERERVTLRKDRAGSGWSVASVAPLVMEDRADAGELKIRRDIFGELLESSVTTAPSTPYVPFMHADSSTPYINPVMFQQAESSTRSSIVYNRRQVQQYADRWWNSANPAYIHFEVDCSSYVSQCVRAGGAPMTHIGRRDAGWWYQGKQNGRELWSYSWAVAHSLYHYLSTSRTGLRAEIVGHPMQLTIGDVISYDWDGDGRFEHSTVVTAIAADGMPLVNAHTVDSYHRYWEYRDSYAWTERTRYRFFHILDEL